MNPPNDVPDRRVNYERGRLDEADAAPEPFLQFTRWFEAALREDGIVEPHAMALATADTAARPSSRIVLLRGYDARGFAFFTNYESRKGRQIAENAAAALLFWWGSMQRQIRIEGTIERIASADSDAYFARRPRGHRLSAWASRQSATVPDRATLERAMEGADARFPGDDVARPPYWGGFRLVPTYFEFWQGRASRVHDRLAYEPCAEGGWKISRLAP